MKKNTNKIFKKFAFVLFISILISIWSISNLVRIPVIDFPQKVGNVMAATITFTYSTPGTSSWTAPAGVTSVDVEAWGGGGGGGSRTTTGCGGGGGGGAYAKSTISVTPGQSYSYTVGSGGSAGNSGGDSSFNTSNIIAKGGSSVASNTSTGAGGGLSGNSTGTTKYSGGSGWTCTSTAGGGGGGSGGTGSDGVTATSYNGASSVTEGGPGGKGATSNANGNSPTVGPGGGGGGSYRTTLSKTGGSGQYGAIRFTYTLYTVLGNGTNGSNSSIGPGASTTEIDRFSLVDGYSTDNITNLTVTLGPDGAYNNIGTVSVQTTGGVSKCSTSSITSNTITLSSCAIAVTTILTEYKIMVTPKTATAMPSPPGTSYDTTAIVTGWTGTNTQTGTDTGSATVTIDNASPNGATSTSGSAGSSRINLGWTTSNSSDFNTTSGSVIYRWASGSAGSEVPAEGSTPSAGDINGTATVACVISSSASTAMSKIDGTGGNSGCTTTALTNGQVYSYKIFQKDTSGNYDTGISIGSFTPVQPNCSSQSSIVSWSASGTWTAGCSGANGQPIAGDIATITAGTYVIVDGAQAAAAVTIENTGTLIFASGASLTLNGTSGTILTNNGSLTTGSNSNIIFSGTSSPTALLSGNFTGANAFYNLTLSPTITSSVSYSMGTAFSVNGNFTLDPTSSGSNTLTATLGGNITVAGTTDIKAETSATSVLDTGNNYSLNVSSVNIEAGGILNANGSEITIDTANSTFNVVGTFNPGQSTIVFSGNNSFALYTISGSVNFYNLQAIDIAYLVLNNPITINGNLSISGGSYLFDNGNHITGNSTGTLSVGAGSFLAIDSGLLLGGVETSVSSFPTLFTRNHINLDPESFVYYVSESPQVVSSVPIYGILELAGGNTGIAVKTTDGDITLTGIWAVDSATAVFQAGSHTVYLSGADASTQQVLGSTTFNNLVATTTANSSGRTILFGSGSTTTVTGTITMTGEAGKILTLGSDDVDPWTITPTSVSVGYLDVSNSINTVGTICATHSTGSSDSGWVFSSGASCNSVPDVPSLDFPSNGATNQSTNISLKITATDTDSDYLRYRIVICKNPGMSSNCQTFDEASSQTGWSGQNTDSNNSYTSGSQAVYTIQTALSPSTTYYWKSYAIDPAGTNIYGSAQGTPYSFTTTAVSLPPGNGILNFGGGINMQGVDIN